MKKFKRKLAFSLKLLKAHFFLHFISYGFSALNYTFVFLCKKKFIIIILLAVQTLLLIFILQMICLLKFSFFFKIFNSMNSYKIVISVMEMLYYILDGIIFVYEYFIILKQIKNAKSNRIMMQTTINNNHSQKNCKSETMDSDKTKKIVNEKFVKDDTIYIIYGNNNTENNKKRNKNSKNKQKFKK